MRFGSVINTIEELSDVSDEVGEMVSTSADGPVSSLVVALVVVFALPVSLSRGLRSGVVAARGRHAVDSRRCQKKSGSRVQAATLR